MAKPFFVFLVVILVLGIVTAVYSLAMQNTAALKQQEGTGSQFAMVSFNFDDGYLSSYRIALPIFNAAGFKTTQYMITKAFLKSGYVNQQQILAMQAEGHEIGAHTRTHPYLTQLTPAQAWEEIFGSRQDLLNIGIRSVDTLAYPYGDENAAIEKMAKEAGFTGARTTNPGLNDPGSDRFLLRRQRVQSDTSFDEVKKSIDEAIQEKKWAILVFHRTDENGEIESARHELIQKIVDYVKQKKVPVVTTAEGLKILDGSQ